MKNRKYLVGLVVLPFLAFCTKDDVQTPDFDVTVETREYKINENVTFSFKGAPDNISFYSGEKGKEYQYRNRTVVEGRKKLLNIKTQLAYGSQVDNLKLMVSNDFTGAYDLEGLKKASWKDVTSKFRLATADVGKLGDTLSSGKVDITNELVAGKPFFVAFKYVGLSSPTTTPTQRTWRIYNFDLTTVDIDGTSTILANRSNAGWTPVNVVDAVNATTGLTKWNFTGSTTFFYYDPMSSLLESEGWLITKGFLADVMSPDKGTPIKDYTQRREDYTYSFKTEGVYTVTFVGSNINYTGEKSVVKEFKIKVVK